MHIVIACGTRPDFVKLAPLIRRAKETSAIRTTVLHTGQHYDKNLSEIFFRELGISTPEVILTPQGKTHSERLGSMFREVYATLAKFTEKPDWVVGLGDTNSMLAAAQAAVRLNIPLAHVESGLRSNDPRMPEESIRIIADHLADLLFITEESAERNLLAEGIDPTRIRFVGNLGVETYEHFRPMIETSATPVHAQLNGADYVIATIHRHEHIHHPETLKSIFTVLRDIAKHKKIVLSLHPNTKRQLEKHTLEHFLEPMHVVEPQGYIDFMNLVTRSSGVITDSGGIQEETSHLGIPCATLRDNTERPVTLERGSNRLFPSGSLNADSLGEILLHLERKDFTPRQIPMWNSGVSERILQALMRAA